MPILIYFLDIGKKLTIHSVRHSYVAAPDDCKNLVITNADVDCVKNDDDMSIYPVSCEVKCHHPYTISGMSKISCSATGIWSYNTRPYCAGKFVSSTKNC